MQKIDSSPLSAEDKMLVKGQVDQQLSKIENQDEQLEFLDSMNTLIENKPDEVLSTLQSYKNLWNRLDNVIGKNATDTSNVETSPMNIFQKEVDEADRSQLNKTELLNKAKGEG